MADPQAQPAPQPAQGSEPQQPQYTPEQIDQWRTIAEGYNQSVAQLSAREQELQAQAAQLQAAAQLDQALRSDPQFRAAVQAAVAQQARGAEPPQPGAQSGYVDPAQAAAQLPPQVLQFLQAQQQQLGQVTQTVQTLEQKQRQDLIEGQVQSMQQKYPYANAEEVVNLLMDYPNVSLEATMAASNQHWQQRFQQIQAAQDQARQQNRANSTLGPSGGPATQIDKSAIATAAGRRSTMQTLAAMLAAQGGSE